MPSVESAMCTLLLTLATTLYVCGGHCYSPILQMKEQRPGCFIHSVMYSSKSLWLGPLCAGHVWGREGASQKLTPAGVIPGLLLCCTLFLALHSPIRRWAPYQCLVRARRWTELTNQGDDNVGDGILGAELDPRLEAEPLGLP